MASVTQAAFNFRGGRMRLALTLARFVLLEARRSGLPLLALGAFLAGIGLAGFLSQVALTESANLQTGVLAALFRVTVIFLTAAFVITSVVRESSDKGLELLLSLPMSRSTYYFGKVAGFAACGGLLAAAFSLVMLLWSPPLAVAAWGCSLVLEALLVAAVSLFFVIASGRVVPALAGVGGLYFLGRAISAIQLISVSPLIGDESLVQKFSRWGVDAVAVLMPALDRATQTAWLLYSPPSIGEFLGVAGALLIYTALMVAAGLFDFHRRNL